MKTRACSVVIVFTAILMMSAPVGAVDFPARQEAKYQNVAFIDIDDLYQEYLQGNTVIVDVRSKLEYDTVRVKGAVHIPLGSYVFEKGVMTLADENPGKKIIFYCNGST